MKRLSSPPHGSPRTSGFTLLELMVVVATVGVIVGMSANSLTSSLQSQRLSASANRLASELSATGLQAVRENRSFEVRMVRQRSEFQTDDRLRAVQVHAVDPTSGETTPVNEIITLDPGVIIMESTVHSTVLNHMTSIMPDGYYTLKPSGTTDLPKDATARWCLTLVLEQDLKNAGGALPVNHRVLVINAQTSAVRVY